jgi:hypothetical protein
VSFGAGVHFFLWGMVGESVRVYDPEELARHLRPAVKTLRNRPGNALMHGLTLVAVIEPDSL